MTFRVRQKDAGETPAFLKQDRGADWCSGNAKYIDGYRQINKENLGIRGYNKFGETCFYIVSLGKFQAL